MTATPAPPPTAPPVGGGGPDAPSPSSSAGPTLERAPAVAGLIAPARYALSLGVRAWRRRRAVRRLTVAVERDVAALDGLLRDLGAAARMIGLDAAEFRDEEALVVAAEARQADAERAAVALRARIDEEAARFADAERGLAQRLAAVEERERGAVREVDHLEADLRGLRDRKKELERRRKDLTKRADVRDAETTRRPSGSERDALRASAADLRREAAGLEPERADLDARSRELEGLLDAARRATEAARSEVEQARGALADARTGHRQRRSELESELAACARVMREAEGEVRRSLGTMGTIANLARPERSELAPLYARFDALRAAIDAADRAITIHDEEARGYDRPALVRGAIILGVGAALLISLLCVAIAMS